MTIYQVVYYGNWEEKVLGTFSTKKKAKFFINSIYPYDKTNIKINSIEIDKALSRISKTKYYTNFIDYKNGINEMKKKGFAVKSEKVVDDGGSKEVIFYYIG